MLISRIVFIVPYFGKFPETFQLWLDSCAWNPDFDWLIFTDDRTPYVYPNNVKVHYLDFRKIRELFQRNFDFPICLDYPYKLCDYKPTYGEVFQNYIEDYDFWGFCDIDLVWGNLKKWINKETLSNCIHVSTWGHCSLFRNDKKTNAIYKGKYDYCKFYKDVYQSPYYHFFDEYMGLRLIFQKEDFSTIHIPLFDVSAKMKPFVPTEATLPFCEKPFKSSVVCASIDGVYAYWIEDGIKQIQEFAYVHFAKRKFTIETLLGGVTSVVVVPDKILSPVEIDVNFIKKHMPFFDISYSYEKSKIIGKIDVIRGINRVIWPDSRLQKITDYIFHRKH